jgi:hypothetical protein
MDVDLS